MRCIKYIFLRAMALALCALLTASPAIGEGIRFTLRADVDPAQYPADLQTVLTGLTELLDASSLEGTLVTHGGSFLLDASLLMGEGRSQRATGLQVYGLDSHWGVRSTLLGDQELMINNSALLPFGQKANDWLGVPLDKAALLLPYTHVSALQEAWAIVAPIFPTEESKRYFSRAELDAMARAVLTMCDEDPALSRWLETTGLYHTATWYIEKFLSLPAIVVPGMNVTRTADVLTWDVYFVNILTLKESEHEVSLHFSVPTLIAVDGVSKLEEGALNSSLHASVDDSILVDAAFALPAALPANGPDFFLTLDAKAPMLPDSGLHLSLNAEADGNVLTLRQLQPETGATLLTLTAHLTSFEPASLPTYTPADLTGMNILSVNSDSLQTLMQAIQPSLLSGTFDLLVAAPPVAVQSLMDMLENAGVIDLLADALSGGYGY